MARRKSRKSRERIARRTPPGTSPGTLVVDPHAPRPVIHLITYGPEGVTEQGIEDVRDIRKHLADGTVTWVNVDGLGDAAKLTELGEVFRIHQLALEDVVNVHQRAKVEMYPEHCFIVARTAALAERLETEQLSMFLGRNYVLTFQERQGDSFDPVRERIRRGGKRIRTCGPDYLAYAILDACIDNYFPVLEKFGERLEALEDEVIFKADERSISQIHEAKRDLLALRRAVWPLRESLSSLFREPTQFITEETRIYLRDCYDHTIQIIDLLENYREIASSLMEVYLSSVSNRLNEVMKVLTIFTTIFIPLGFIAGVYGMNFNPEVSPWNMPELNWFWGYPVALVLMVLVAVVMLTFFAKRGWIQSSFRIRRRDSAD